MVKNTRRIQRGEQTLTREHIITASIELLDSRGDSGLTFRALAEALSTGAGAIYYYVNDKDDLLEAACDKVVASTLSALERDAQAHQAICAIGMGLFDSIDAHPWAGRELTRTSWKMPMVRVLEAVGRQVRALGVAENVVQPATFIVLNYIIGVATQNAANGQMARQEKLVRSVFLQGVCDAWNRLDGEAFGFVRSIAGGLCDHDDRVEFLAGLELILDGLAASRSRGLTDNNAGEISPR